MSAKALQARRLKKLGEAERQASAHYLGTPLESRDFQHLCHQILAGVLERLDPMAERQFLASSIPRNGTPELAYPCHFP